MNQIKINPEINIESSESQSNTSGNPKESTKKTPEKNSFEGILSKISELRKGKNFATEEKVNKDDAKIIKGHSLSSKSEELIVSQIGIENKEFLEKDHDNTEKTISDSSDDNNETSDNVKSIEADEFSNPELQSILLGTNTQIITTNETLPSNEQLITYARKAGLNENAISIILKGGSSKKISLKDNSFDKSQSLSDIAAIKPNTLVKKNNPFDLHSIQKKLEIQFSSDENLVENEFKNKPIAKNIKSVGVPNKFEISTSEVIGSENPKNLKIAMKVKDESFLEKLIIKKLEQEKIPVSKQVERLQSIELGARAGHFISSLIAMRNSEISQSTKISDADATLLSHASGFVTSKSESSLSGKQQGSGREQQTEQIQLKRQEQFQQMAQRLGETLAKRISEQISRGAWRVQIALKPASLGSIEINLNLRGKEIEASFLASQNLTRELLAESLPRLKESLEKAGMNVADLNVTGQNNSKSDNNSTNKEEKDKDLKINEIKTVKKEDEKTKGSISNVDHLGGLNILV